MNQLTHDTIDWSLPTAQFLGRFQPWNEGHRGIFEQILAQGNPEWKHQKHNAQQVCIMVRVQKVSDNAPYTYDEVKAMIEADLLPTFEGRFIVLPLPNITDIFHGRTVGVEVHRIHLTEELESLDSKLTRAERAVIEHRFWQNRE